MSLRISHLSLDDRRLSGATFAAELDAIGARCLSCPTHGAAVARAHVAYEVRLCDRESRRAPSAESRRAAREAREALRAVVLATLRHHAHAGACEASG